MKLEGINKKNVLKNIEELKERGKKIFFTLSRNEEYTSFEKNQIRSGNVVIQRSTGRCIGDFNSFEHTYIGGKYISVFQRVKDKIKNDSIDIQIEKFRVGLSCYIIFDHDFRNKIDYTDFEQAMFYFYYRSYQKNIPLTDDGLIREFKRVKSVINKEIESFHRKGDWFYRKDFKRLHPECFISSSEGIKLKYVGDPNISSKQKSAACAKYRQQLLLEAVMDILNKKVIPFIDKYIQKIDGPNNRGAVFSDEYYSLMNDLLTKKGHGIYREIKSIDKNGKEVVKKVCCSRSQSTIKELTQKAIKRGTDGKIVYIRTFLNHVKASKSKLYNSLKQNAKQLKISVFSLKKTFKSMFGSNICKTFKKWDKFELFDYTPGKSTEETGLLKRFALDVNRSVIDYEGLYKLFDEFIPDDENRGGFVSVYTQ